MTQGQMFEKVEKFVEKNYPENTNFWYDVAVVGLDDYSVEIGVYTEDYFGKETLVNLFVSVPFDRRRRISVIDIY